MKNCTHTNKERDLLFIVISYGGSFTSTMSIETYSTLNAGGRPESETSMLIFHVLRCSKSRLPFTCTQ